MKNKKSNIISVFSKMSMALCVLCFIFLSGCTQYNNAEKKPHSPNTANGVKLWSENCGRCHNLRDAKELRDDQWRVSIAHMRTVSGLSGDEARDILAFLQASN